MMDFVCFRYRCTYGLPGNGCSARYKRYRYARHHEMQNPFQRTGYRYMVSECYEVFTQVSNEEVVLYLTHEPNW